MPAVGFAAALVFMVVATPFLIAAAVVVTHAGDSRTGRLYLLAAMISIVWPLSLYVLGSGVSP
jgi:hypothetical protein